MMRRILTSGLFLACVALAAAQGAADERSLAIGFLPTGSDFHTASAQVERLRSALLAQTRVNAALADAGYDGIVLSPCDGPRDMVQRMDQGEFEVALATAVVYGRQRGPYPEPILQSRLPGDFQPPGHGVMRRGVVFVGPACALFERADVTDADVRALLERARLAVPTADSAAGYIYPRLALREAPWRVEQPGGFLFCGNDDEVVKHVVSGLVEVGACREGAPEHILARSVTGAPDERPYYRILFRTDPFPTDPILLRKELLPARSALGRELKVALRAYYNDGASELPTGWPMGLGVEDASRRDYEALGRALGALADSKP